MGHFIRWYDGVLPAETCEQIIARFETDDRKIAGLVSGNEGGELDTDRKQTTELILYPEKWHDIQAILEESLADVLGYYQRDVKFLAGSDHTGLHCEPLRIKKYDIGGQFHWHIDDNAKTNTSRDLAVQWYFNDVAEGGRTEFEDQDKAVDCVTGRVACFPVGWTYRHRGAPPMSNPKYVCTTFVHREF